MSTPVLGCFQFVSIQQWPIDFGKCLCALSEAVAHQQRFTQDKKQKEPAQQTEVLNRGVAVWATVFHTLEILIFSLLYSNQ